MRGSLGSFEFVEDAVEKFVNDSRQGVNDFRNQVVVDPNFHWDSSTFRFKGWTLQELQGLAILSWFLGDLGWKIRSDLSDHTKFLSLDDKIVLELLIDNRAETMIWLQESNYFHHRDFFGNILRNALNKLKFLRFSNPRTKVKYPQRKRGYNDHGSRADDPYWKSARNYQDDIEQQILLEQKRQTYLDTLSLLRGWVS